MWGFGWMFWLVPFLLFAMFDAALAAGAVGGDGSRPRPPDRS